MLKFWQKGFIHKSLKKKYIEDEKKTFFLLSIKIQEKMRKKCIKRQKPFYPNIDFRNTEKYEQQAHLYV